MLDSTRVGSNLKKLFEWLGSGESGQIARALEKFPRITNAPDSLRWKHSKDGAFPIIEPPDSLRWKHRKYGAFPIIVHTKWKVHSNATLTRVWGEG